MKERKKILFFCNHFYPFKGGLENYVLNLSKRLVQKGFSVGVITLNIENKSNVETHEGVKIYRLPYLNVLKGVYSLPLLNKEYKKVMKEVNKEGYELVNTQTRFFFTSLMGLWYAKKNKIPLIHTEHGNSFVQHPNKIVEFCSWLYDMTIGKFIFRSADLTIGISDACVEFAKRMGAKKVTMIPNSVDTNKFRVVNVNRKTKKKIITYVGRLIYAKGVHDLIEATEGMSNVELLIIGDGPYKNQLKKRSNVHYFGSLNQKQIRNFLSFTDVFVNPSYSEGLPTSVLEASSVGVPNIIATKVGGTEQILGNYGVYVKPKCILCLRNAILNANKKELNFNLRRRIINKFDWNNNVDKYIKLSKLLLNP